MPPLSRSARNGVFAVGLLCMAGTFAAVPWIAARRSSPTGERRNLTLQPGALSPAAVSRGAFLNTGTRDVGADPSWTKGADGSMVWTGKAGVTVPESEVAEFKRARAAARAAVAAGKA